MTTQLPHAGDGLYYTDGGLETTLVFLDGLELPEFAAFPLLDSEVGRQRLRDYYREYLAIAEMHGAGFVLETPTWRSSRDWGQKLGYDADALDRINQGAVRFVRDLAEASSVHDVVISGNVGPRGDGYVVAERMTAEEARAYHGAHIGSFAKACADVITAMTMNYSNEAVGIARAAADYGVPAIISFTVETDGRLPSGETLAEAIEHVDAEAPGAVAYYMLNCAHPTHFDGELAVAAPWTERLRGLRANASTSSHAELDAATELDRGDPADLASRYMAIRAKVPGMTVLGGCCGTDAEHIAAIAAAARDTLAEGATVAA